MMRLLMALFVGLLALGPDVALSQALQAGPQVLTFFSEVDDTDQPYALYLPPHFDETRQYPLVISLHGAGSNHRLNLRRVFGQSNAPGENDVEATRYFPEWDDVDYIVASPFARGTMGYQGVAENDVMQVLADVQRRFPIDVDRIYLTGLSMGGGGTLWIGLTRPDVWAAMAPVCPAPPPGTINLAGNALNVPVHLHQGAEDTVVPPDEVRAWADTLDALGTNVTYSEYPDVGHNSWENAYQSGQIFDWFDRFERHAHPERVRFATQRYKYNEAYWVRIDALTPGTQAQIDARFTAVNQVTVATEALDGFTFRLAGHPQVDRGQPMTVRIDGDTLRVQAADSLSFSLRNGRWRLAPWVPGPTSKRPGAEGPMSEALAERHIYVYGTADDPSEEELQRRRVQALTAATWSVYRGPFWRRVKVFPRIVADRDVRESDVVTSNLVLFGTRSTNRIIDRFGDRLPLHLNPSADGYGLAYVFPVGDHYVLINSGQAWWSDGTGGESESPFVNQVPALELMGWPDFRLFKGAADSVLVEGRFNRAWRLPREDARALRATGAVVLSEEASR